jgi:hypothetical protein
MSTRSSYGIAALLIAGGLTLAGCGGPAQGADDAAPAEMATVETPAEGAPGIVTLAEAAQQRLDLRTVPVTAGPDGLVVPYSAVVYEPDGSSWAYVQSRPLTYQRAPIEIASIVGDQVTLISGPEPGTEVVTQGAAELVGVETGIDGEE